MIIKTSSNLVTIDSTGSIKLPSGTEAERPATPANGMMRYNSDGDVFEGYAGGAWVNTSGTPTLSEVITAGGTYYGDDFIEMQTSDEFWILSEAVNIGDSVGVVSLYGNISLANYQSANGDGTPVKTLGVDANGFMVKSDAAVPTLQQVITAGGTYSGADSIGMTTSDEIRFEGSGSMTIEMDGGISIGNQAGDLALNSPNVYLGGFTSTDADGVATKTLGVDNSGKLVKSDAAVPTLQDVTDAGTTTTNPITITLSENDSSTGLSITSGTGLATDYVFNFKSFISSGNPNSLLMSGAGQLDLKSSNAMPFRIQRPNGHNVLGFRNDAQEGSITYYGEGTARYGTGVIEVGADYVFRVGYNSGLGSDLPSMNNIMELDKRGKLTLGKYTSNNSIHDATPTAFLGVDDDGNVVKTEGSQVTAQYVRVSLPATHMTGGASEIDFDPSLEVDVVDMAQDYSTGSDISYSAGTFTVNRDGLYTIRINAEFQSLVTQRACPTAYFKVNGTVVDGKSLAYVRQNGNVDEGTVNLSRTMYLVDGDTLTVHNRNQGTTNGGSVTTANQYMVEIYSNNVSVTAPATPTLAEVQTAGNSVLKLQNETADPSSPEKGWMYFNETTNKFRGYNGTAWVDLA
tara:strand:+ start:9140 stop:11026 length:1887 start_codon:yes stop_codon:yes gene_type:complete